MRRQGEREQVFERATQKRARRRGKKRKEKTKEKLLTFPRETEGLIPCFPKVCASLLPPLLFPPRASTPHAVSLVQVEEQGRKSDEKERKVRFFWFDLIGARKKEKLEGGRILFLFRHLLCPLPLLFLGRLIAPRTQTTSLASRRAREIGLGASEGVYGRGLGFF